MKPHKIILIICLLVCLPTVASASCSDYCVDSIRFFNGQNIGGECVYDTEVCRSTCDSGICVDVRRQPVIKRTSFEYDGYGNPIKIVHHGDVNIDGDEKTEVTIYYQNINKWILDKARNKQLLNENSAKISEEWYSYDLQSYGQSPIKGDITKHETWNNHGANIASEFRYDNYGNMIKVIDPKDFEYSYEYDDTHTFLSKFTNPLNHQTLYTYDKGLGQIISTTSPHGVTTNFTYNWHGRLQKEIHPYNSEANPTIEYEYNQNGTAPSNIKTISGPYESTTYYDGFGRAIQVKSNSDTSQKITIDTEYDEYGNEISTSLPYLSNQGYTPRSTSIPNISKEYDILGRMISQTNPDNSQIFNVFSHHSSIVYDEKMNKKELIYDTYENIIKVKEYNQDSTYITTYDYDKQGNLLSVQDNQGNSITYTYDSINRKLSSDDPDLGYWNYSYDKNSNLEVQTDSKGNTITMEYDNTDRPTKKITPDEEIILTYDENKPGVLSTITTPHITKQFYYDSRLRLINETKTIDGVSYTTSYSYDKQDNLLSKTLPNGEIIEYTYSNQNLIDSIPGVIDNINHLPSSMIASIEYNNNLLSEFFYNNNSLRLETIKNSNLQTIDYSYDEVGNIISTNNDGNLKEYSYDNLNRITSSTQNNLTYTYDSIGNLKEISSLTLLMTFIFNGSAHAPTFVINSHNTRYCLDLDNDGYFVVNVSGADCGPTDCNDTDASINPGETEVCNNRDDNCNNIIDENIQTRNTGTNIGECEFGIQSCISGSWQTTQQGVGPINETCDNKDNDCDDIIDEDLDNQTSGIDIGECRKEIKSCVSGTWQVAQSGINPTNETCDGLDNDCDTIIDNGGNSLCQDTFYCNGEEVCSGTSGCTAGTQVSCNNHSVSEIRTCTSQSDNNTFTLDYFAGFQSSCNENTDSCTVANIEYTHSCNKSLCFAECETDSDCNDNNSITLDTCNLCECEHQTVGFVSASINETNLKGYRPFGGYDLDQDWFIRGAGQSFIPSARGRPVEINFYTKHLNGRALFDIALDITDMDRNVYGTSRIQGINDTNFQWYTFVIDNPKIMSPSEKYQIRIYTISETESIDETMYGLALKDDVYPDWNALDAFYNSYPRETYSIFDLIFNVVSSSTCSANNECDDNNISTSDICHYGHCQNYPITNLAFSSGWNYVSFPFTDGININEINRTCNIIPQLWFWENESYYLEQNIQLRGDKAYVLYSFEDCTIQMPFNYSTFNFNPVKGWNLVPSKWGTGSIDDISGDCIIDNTVWTHENGNFVEATVLNPGKAIWVHVQDNCSFYAPRRGGGSPGVATLSSMPPSMGTINEDRDDDGYSNSEDCNDNHPMVYPGAIEVCNGIDDNCDGVVDENGDSFCSDGKYCNGEESCVSGSCVSGDSVDCSLYNIQSISTCNNNPDNNQYTLDYISSYESYCDEDTDSCSRGGAGYSHTCSISECGAECETNNDCSSGICSNCVCQPGCTSDLGCPDKCVEEIHYSGGECSDSSCVYNMISCNAFDGYFDTSGRRWQYKNMSQEEQKYTEYRDYYCGNGCEYRVNHYTWQTIRIEDYSYTVDLDQGWNLVSFALDSNISISEVQSQCNIMSPVWYWEDVGYKVEYNELSPEKGYSMYSHEECEISFDFTKDNLDLELNPGWNLIPSANHYIYRKDIDTNCNITQKTRGIDNNLYYNVELIQPGQAYWVHVKEGCTINYTR